MQVDETSNRIIKAAKRTLRAEIVLVVIICLISSLTLYSLYKLTSNTEYNIDQNEELAQPQARQRQKLDWQQNHRQYQAKIQPERQSSSKFVGQNVQQTYSSGFNQNSVKNVVNHPYSFNPSKNGLIYNNNYLNSNTSASLIEPSNNSALRVAILNTQPLIYGHRQPFLPTQQILSSQIIPSSQQTSLTQPMQSTLQVQSPMLMQQDPNQTTQFLNQSQQASQLAYLQQLLQAKAASASQQNQQPIINSPFPYPNLMTNVTQIKLNPNFKQIPHNNSNLSDQLTQLLELQRERKLRSVIENPSQQIRVTVPKVVPPILTSKPIHATVSASKAIQKNVVPIRTDNEEISNENDAKDDISPVSSNMDDEDLSSDDNISQDEQQEDSTSGSSEPDTLDYAIPQDSIDDETRQEDSSEDSNQKQTGPQESSTRTVHGTGNEIISPQKNDMINFDDTTTISPFPSIQSNTLKKSENNLENNTKNKLSSNPSNTSVRNNYFDNNDHNNSTNFLANDLLTKSVLNEKVSKKNGKIENNQINYDDDLHHGSLEKESKRQIIKRVKRTLFDVEENEGSKDSLSTSGKNITNVLRNDQDLDRVLNLLPFDEILSKSVKTAKVNKVDKTLNPKDARNKIEKTDRQRVLKHSFEIDLTPDASDVDETQNNDDVNENEESKDEEDEELTQNDEPTTNEESNDPIGEESVEQTDSLYDHGGNSNDSNIDRFSFFGLGSKDDSVKSYDTNGSIQVNNDQGLMQSYPIIVQDQDKSLDMNIATPAQGSNYSMPPYTEKALTQPNGLPAAPGYQAGEQDRLIDQLLQQEKLILQTEALKKEQLAQLGGVNQSLSKQVSPTLQNGGEAGTNGSSSIVSKPSSAEQSVEPQTQAGSLFTVDHGLLLEPARAESGEKHKKYKKKKKKHKSSSKHKKMKKSMKKYKKGGEKHKKMKKDIKKMKKEKEMKSMIKGKKVEKAKKKKGKKSGSKKYKDKGYKKKGFKKEFHRIESGKDHKYFDEFRDKDFKKKYESGEKKFKKHKMKKYAGKDEKKAKKEKEHSESYKKFKKGRWKKKYSKKEKKSHKKKS